MYTSFMEKIIEKICVYSKINISIPKKQINKYSTLHTCLKEKEVDYFRRQSKYIENKIYQLQHIASLIHRILLRAYT